MSPRARGKTLLIDVGGRIKMLYPSVDKLQEKIDSKYSLVSLAAKRARQMQEHEDTEQLEKYVSYKPVGRALEEVAAGVLTKKEQKDGTIYEDEI